MAAQDAAYHIDQKTAVAQNISEQGFELISNLGVIGVGDGNELFGIAQGALFDQLHNALHSHLLALTFDGNHKPVLNVEDGLDAEQAAQKRWNSSPGPTVKVLEVVYGKHVPHCFGNAAERAG